MQREIKFRGKRRDTKQWVYGSLIDKDYILQYIDLAQSWEPLTSDHKVICRAFEIISETVGQYTGLKDKNGKEIYEGDIYKVCLSKNTYQVMFVGGAFVGGKSKESCMPLCWDKDEDDENEIIEADTMWLEIIGNIHDNPELVNQPTGGALNMNIEPNVKQAEATEQEAAQESASQDQAMGASEEVTEG